MMLAAVSLGAAQILIESRWIACCAEFYLRGQVSQQGHFECGGNSGSDLGLKLQDIAEIFVVGLGPQVESGHRVAELRSDTDRPSGAAHASLEHGSYVQLVSHGRDVGMLSLEREG